MPDEVILNKCAVLERCLARIREDYIGSEEAFRSNYTIQDAVILNLLRACEAAIDLALHLVKVKALGVPQDSRSAFRLLAEAGLVPKELSDRMQAMVGFRNIAVHDYQKLNQEILLAILEERLSDFEDFRAACFSLA